MSITQQIQEALRQIFYCECMFSPSCTTAKTAGIEKKVLFVPGNIIPLMTTQYKTVNGWFNCQSLANDIYILSSKRDNIVIYNPHNIRVLSF